MVATVDPVVVGPAPQDIVAVAADDHIIAVAAVNREREVRRQIAAGAKRIIAFAGVYFESLGVADVDAERHPAGAF